jgi:hypothetical protein
LSRPSSSALRQRLCKSAWSIGFCSLFLGCAPKIIAFNVQPRRICAEDTVRITWKVRGIPHFLAVRRSEELTDIIRYTIVAQSHGKTAFSSMEVITISPQVARVFGPETVPLGTDSLVARDSARAAVWHDLVRVGEVISDSGRVLRVRHAGREGTIGPGRAASRVWEGLPVSGVWEIFSGLQLGEVMGDPARHPPLHLFLRVSVVCSRRPVQR